MASQLRATWMLRLLVTVVAAVVGLLAWPGSVAAGATGTTVGPRPAATYDDAVDAPLGLADGRYAQVVADVRSGSTGTTRFLTVVATNTAKRGPKPFGVGPHNQTIASVADSVTDGRVIAGGQTGLPEAVISTPGGLKGTRRPDILVERADAQTLQGPA